MEKLIKGWLKKSEIALKEKVFVFFHANFGVVKMKTTHFIEYWNEIQFWDPEVVVVCSEDGDYFLEFSQHKDLYSNFEILNDTLISKGCE